MIKGIRLCIINCLPVTFHPFPHGQQGIPFKFHHGTISPRTNVQQEITSPTYHLHQTAQLLINLFIQTPPLLPRTIAPCLVKKRSRGLPGHSNLVIRVSIICHYGKISPVISQTPAHHTLRLQTIHKIIQFLTLLSTQRTHIKPDFRNRTVICHDLFHLMHTERMMFL